MIGKKDVKRSGWSLPNLFSQHLFGGTKENYGKLSDVIQPSGRELNLRPPEALNLVF
jgi:hypothetical protein